MIRFARAAWSCRAVKVALRLIFCGTSVTKGEFWPGFVASLTAVR